MFYTSVKISRNSPDCSCDADLILSLEAEEQKLEFEHSKLLKYRNIENSLEIQVKYLTKDFLQSESLFQQCKKELYYFKLPDKPDFLLTSLFEILAYSPSQNQSFKKSLLSFTYASLTDDHIEKYFPLWKNKSTTSPNCQEIFNFIGATIECKMKSDLLNAASDRLSRTINRIEGVKLAINKTEKAIQEIQSKLAWTLSSQKDLRIENLYNTEHNSIFFLKSEDLYGLDCQRENSSTIIYLSEEEKCETCKCMPF